MSKRLLQTLAGDVTDRPPFWFMRQAGRYLPEYRAIREDVKDFLTLCYSPDLAAEVTLQPIRRFGMDAAILFADILLVCDALGQDLAYREGEGPVLEPIRSTDDIEYLAPEGCHEVLAPVYETVARVKAGLDDETALIGFAGAPWTVAAYMVEGGGSKDFSHPRLWALQEPEGFQRLIDLLVEVTIDYLDNQIVAGAEAVQLFDSWAGLVPAAGFERWCVAPVRAIAEGLKEKHPDVPVIGFPRGAGAQIVRYGEATGVDAVALDQSIPPYWAAGSVPEDVVLQGNQDPLSVVAGGEEMIRQARSVVEAFSGRPFIYNLGHGIVPQTPPEHVGELSDWLKGL